MEKRIDLPYEAVRNIALDILKHTDFSNDEEVIDAIKTALGIEFQEAAQSEIVIDAECRIFLPAFSNEEVEMKSLPKAVFILFLFHKEGLYYKMLKNHQQELEDIYLTLKKNKNIDLFKAKETIRKLVDPRKNRIYEICSQIKRALQPIVPEEVFDLYSITGKKDKRFRIEIDRKLMQIENEDLKNIAPF